MTKLDFDTLNMIPIENVSDANKYEEVLELTRSLYNAIPGI